MFSRKRGVTLIELMVVVLVVGILASLSLLRFSSAAIKAKIQEAAILLKHLWELEVIYYYANGFAITHDGYPCYFGVTLGNPVYEEMNRKKLSYLAFSPPSGKPRFWYVSTEDAVVFAFPKTSSSPFAFPDDEIDRSLRNLSLAIDNDGTIYIYNENNEGDIWVP
ncbi:prepilin-type N-terminal cleavage/methylation domain-containing protein [bacterium]|nr:prepilin-type N-terminal cleavage/methylation domain-containing protein [bacterium]